MVAIIVIGDNIYYLHHQNIHKHFEIINNKIFDHGFTEPYWKKIFYLKLKL